MRYIFTFFSLVMFMNFSFTQTCDILTTGLKISSSEIIQGQTTDIVFSIKNDAKGVNCSYEARSVQVFLFLPEDGLKFEQIVSPTGGSGAYFDWTYDAENKTLVGLNHRPIGDGQGDTNITVRVKADRINKTLISKTVGLSILQYHEGAVFPSNDQSNDNSIVSLRIKTDVAQQNIKVEAFNSDCNVIDLFITPGESFKDIEGFDILRSADEKNYVKAGSLSVNGSRQSTFTFSDNQGLENGNVYTYMFQVLSKDGSVKTLKTEPVKNDCTTQQADFDFFPNPAVDKIFLNLRGAIKNELVDLVFTNVSGEQVKRVKSVSNNQNEVSLDGMPSGVYFIKIVSKENLSSKRFVKIDY